MRIFVLSTIAVLALAVTGASQTASTATKAVSIKATAFAPKNVTINTGDAVKWTNSDTKNHQVIANNGAFASPTIAPGKTGRAVDSHDREQPVADGSPCQVLKRPPARPGVPGF